MYERHIVVKANNRHELTTSLKKLNVIRVLFSNTQGFNSANNYKSQTGYKKVERAPKYI